MSRSKAELSLKAREILQFIRYRTKVSKTKTYFGSNENIATYTDVTVNTAKQLVNKLVREGYLERGYDEQKRRHLLYTGKPYVEIVEDMRNYEKRGLKSEKEYYEREANDAKYELELKQIRIEALENENARLQNKLFCSELRVQELENLFLSQGCTKDQIDMMIKQTQEMQMVG